MLYFEEAVTKARCREKFAWNLDRWEVCCTVPMSTPPRVCLRSSAERVQ